MPVQQGDRAGLTKVVVGGQCLMLEMLKHSSNPYLLPNTVSVYFDIYKISTYG